MTNPTHTHNTVIEQWWVLARSEDVGRKKPLAVHCAPHEIVLFRDASNQVRALEDRCPHRRAPLSLGKIRDEGWLQCGYHGWTFDGENGQCRKIPNLNIGERVPKHTVQAYPVCERDGLVHVWIGAENSVPEQPPAALPYVTGRGEFSASLTLSLSHSHYFSALLDGPQTLLHLPGMRITDHLLGDPKWRDGFWVSERGMTCAGPGFPGRFVRDYPLILRLSVAPHTGLAIVEACNADEQVLASAVISCVPGARGTTALCWRSRRHSGGGWRTALARVTGMFGKAPIAPIRHPDGAALAALHEGPSRVLRMPALIFTTAQQQVG